MLKIRAKIEFIPSDVKDKSKPIMSGKYAFRPNHKFTFNESFFIGQVMLKDNDVIYYGDVREAEVWFIDEFNFLRENLKVGTKWQLQGGVRLIALGEVLEMIS